MQENDSSKRNIVGSFKIIGTFYKDKCFPSLNDYLTECGKNPIAGGRMKRQMMQVAIYNMRFGLKDVKITPPIVLHYRFYEPKSGKKRDVMNVFSMADKVIEDALVKAQFIEDDNPKYIKNTTHEFFYDEKPRIEVDIEEVPNV